MSLNVVLVKKCDPLEAQRTFDVQFYEGLEKIQPTGFLNVRDVARVGRNCMGDKWHRLFDAEEECPRIFFPENWTEIKKWLKRRFVRQGDFFEPPPSDGWDFMYICW